MQSENRKRFPLVSSCHGAELGVSCGDENTNFYFCTQKDCRQPCNAIPDEGLEENSEIPKMANSSTKRTSSPPPDAKEGKEEYMDRSILARAHNWIVSDDTGASSKIIWARMMHIINKGYSHAPCDPSDFGRCYRLLKLIPEWEKRLAELRFINNEWFSFVKNYEKLKELYEEEAQKGSAAKLYKFMREIGL